MYRRSIWRESHQIKRDISRKVSDIYITETTQIFADINNPFRAIRYHSLIVSRENLPKELLIIASTKNGEIMALKHQNYDIFGVQFHPESVLTHVGQKLIENFLSIGGGNNV